MGEGKLISLARAAGLVADGDHITIGDLESLSPPTPAELAALEALDPDRLRDLDFR